VPEALSALLLVSGGRFILLGFNLPQAVPEALSPLLPEYQGGIRNLYVFLSFFDFFDFAVNLLPRASV
jgi:hypothetical protein